MAMPVVEFSKESYKIRISVRIPWRILRTDGFSFRFFLIVFFTYHVKHKAINANWGSFATFLPHTNVSSVMFQKSSSCVANPDRNRPYPTLIKNNFYSSKPLKCFKMYPIWKILGNKCIFLSQKQNSYWYFNNLMYYDCHEITILP